MMLNVFLIYLEFRTIFRRDWGTSRHSSLVMVYANFCSSYSSFICILVFLLRSFKMQSAGDLLSSQCDKTFYVYSVVQLKNVMESKIIILLGLPC
jgi:hypothetical protein